MEYKATVNENNSFLFDEKSLESMDLIMTGSGSYHLIDGSKSYSIDVLEQSAAEKTMLLRINGRNYQVKLEDSYDLLVNKLGFNKIGDQKIKQIKAPMPGLVLEVITEKGKEIEKGDSLLILEAMKMENIIKSAGSGTIKKIHVNKGDKVEKNQLLIEID